MPNNNMAIYKSKSILYLIFVVFINFTQVIIFFMFIVSKVLLNLSRHVGKPTICIDENKGEDQLRGNREADQRLCFRYSDSTIPPLLNSKMSSF